MKLLVGLAKPEMGAVCKILGNAISLVVAVLMLVARAYIARLEAQGSL